MSQPKSQPRTQLLRQIHPKARTFSLICLGCSKNLVDAERIAGLLTEAGWRIVREPRGAACVIVHTCGFLQSSRDESWEHIERALQWKRAGEVSFVVVTGCFAQRDDGRLGTLGAANGGITGKLATDSGSNEVGDDAAGNHSATAEIDAVVGVTAREQIVAVLEALERRRRTYHGDGTGLNAPAEKTNSSNLPAPDEKTSGTPDSPQVWFAKYPCPISDDRRYRLTPQHIAYLKIAEGCDRRCSYCAIPIIRGPHVSKPIYQAVAEARELVASGAREIILLAQDLTFYGLDWLDATGRRTGPQLATLLRELVAIPNLKWIRLMYLYPMHVTDELIDVIASEPKVLPYLDIPLQHASDAILRSMNRVVDRARMEELLTKLRERIPGLVLRTTMMVGFPGETDAVFEELCEFVQRWRFERLGGFVFSPEPGTRAFELPESDQIPTEVAEQRFRRLMKIQSGIAFAWNDSQIGRVVDVILDTPIRSEKNTWIGRTAGDAPDVDGVVYVTGGDTQDLAQGQIVPCEIVASQGFDLVAVPTE